MSHDGVSLARIIPPPQPLGTIQLLRTAVRNPIEMWPEIVYREPVFVRRYAGRDNVFVCDPHVIREILVDQADAFEKAEPMRRALEPALGRGLLTAEGDHWRRQRRAAAPIFRHDRLLGFAADMVAAAETTAHRWAERQGEEIDVAREMMLTTFDVIVRTMLGGVEIDARRVETAVNDYLDPLGWVIAYNVIRLPDGLPFPGRRRHRRARDCLREESLRLIAERRAAGARRGDLIDLLLDAADPETGRSMGDRELADNLVTFITAGHETTALALTWSFYLLDRYPEAADAIRAEVEAATGGAPLTGEHVASLVFTRQVLNEAMRLYPPAALVVREPTRDVVCGGLTIRAGSQVYVPIYSLHRHRTLWSDPDAFDPSRFSAEAVQARPRYAYLPFGAGPRICIGMSFALIEAALILGTLVRRFRPKLRPGYEPELRLRVTLRPKDGMPMRIERE